MMAKLMGTLMTIGALVALSSGSAIPMWEFLSRGEKMSHLYSMFAKQVSSHCKSGANDLPVALCKRDLLVYGIGRLEHMSDAYLDAMDPYQRGVNDLIWDSMVEGHSSKPAKRVHHSTASPIREPSGPYERNPLFDDVSSSSSSSGSTHTPSYNDRLNEAASSPSGYAAADMDMMDMYASGAGSEPQQDNRLQSEPTNVHVSRYGQQQQIYLTGPMIIRVRPDGTPVEEDRQRQLPRDDDREAMTIGRAKLPTIQQITNEFGGDASAAAATASSSYRTAQRQH